MANKKVYSEHVKSKLTELYRTSDDIAEKDASLMVFDVPITYKRIISSLKEQPFVETHRKSSGLDFETLDHKRIDAACKSLATFPKSKETAVIEVVKVSDNPSVQFMHSAMITVKNERKFAAPRMAIDLSGQTIGERCGVRINTGYIIKINKLAMGKAISNQTIVNTEYGSQPDIIVVPQIVSKHSGLVQCMYGRDPEDTGLLTINFTTTEAFDTSVRMQVVLLAYVVDRPLGLATLHQSESAAELFKAKDNRSGRWIKNPKTKYLASSFDTTTLPGSLLLSTFDNSKTPSVPFKQQKIKIEKITALFTSRKREWFNSNLLTSIGLYQGSAANVANFAPIVVRSPGTDLKHNTHGLVFLKHRLTVFSVAAEFDYDCRLLNGAFVNLPLYDEINRDIRKVRTALNDLAIGAKICKKLVADNPTYKLDDLVRVFDYDRTIRDDERLASKVTSSHEQLFNERPAELNCYSVTLYKGLKSLAYQCCSHAFTADQVRALSMECSTVASDGAAVETSGAAVETSGDAPETCSQKRPIEDDSGDSEPNKRSKQ